MKNIYKEGDKVFWKWGKAKLKGTVIEVYSSAVEKTIKGSVIKRNANKENPAYFIKKDNNSAYVLKLHSEILST